MSLPDLNDYSQHRHYRNLNPSPKAFLNALIAVCREKKSRVVIVTLAELGIRCGNKADNNRKRLKKNREQLEALRFIRVLKALGTRALKYELVDDWRELTDAKYKEIIDGFKQALKKEVREQHEKRIQNDPQYKAPWGVQDALEYVRNRPRLYRREVIIY